jgi:signal transduction histidine kinase
MLMAVPSVLFLSIATIWASWAFWRHAGLKRSGGARFVAVALFLWGLHHLDYFILRPQGSGQAWSTYIDLAFELAVGIGFGLMALSEFANRLTLRTGELGRLSGLMVRQHEAERRRLSRDLHDETAQTLSAVKLEVGMLREGADTVVQERLDHVLALVDGGIRGIRRVMNDLRPALLDDLGLAPAIHSLAADVGERSRLKVRTDLPDTTPRLAPDAELALFRAAQEALANVVRHAEASEVVVRLRVEGNSLKLMVEDDGRGLARPSSDPEQGHGHLGLAGMRERIGALGGTVDIRASRKKGVSVIVSVPVDNEKEAGA